MKWQLPVILLLTMLGATGQNPYNEKIGDLAVMASEQASPEQFQSFKEEHIEINPLPIHHPAFQSLVVGYMEWYSQTSNVDFSKVIREFKNDTLRQFGFIKTIEYQFSNSKIDSAEYQYYSDSLRQVILAPILAEYLKNQNFRLRMENRIPDFEYTLKNGDRIKFSELKESYVLLEFPLPPIHDDPSLNGHIIFKDYSNIKVIRTFTSFFENMEDESEFVPNHIDMIIKTDSPIDLFYHQRTSPRWILITNNLEIMARDFSPSSDSDIKKIKDILDADLISKN